MDIARRTMQTAQHRYEVARHLYVSGSSTILDLNSAISMNLYLTPAKGYSRDSFQISVLDKDGVVAPDADNLLSFKVKGPGVLVATDAGDPTCHTPFHSPEIQAFHGLCSAIVRRTGPGEITVSVSAKGLNDSKIILP